MLRKEVHKFILSTLICVLYLLWNDSNHFTIPILELFSNFLNDLFNWPPYFLIIALTFYVVFNIVYFIIYFIQKRVVKRNFNILMSTFIIFTLYFLYIALNKEYSYIIYKDYYYQHSFPQDDYFVKNELGDVDSLNFQNFTWSSKNYITSIPPIYYNKELRFESDSTAVLTGWLSHYNLIFMVRHIFGIHDKEYKLIYNLIGDTLIFKDGEASFKYTVNEQQTIRIEEDKLLFSPVYLDSTIYVQEIGD